MNFASCSSDDDESAETSYELGKAEGEKLNAAYQAYSINSDILTQTTQGAIMYAAYAQYKANSSDAKWKSGFLAGATNADTSKYDELADLLNGDYSLTDPTSLSNLLTKLSSLLGGK